MTHAAGPVPPGFHEGELAVQRLTGSVGQAARLEGMLDPADLGPAAGFLSAQSLAVLTARDRDGHLWSSPLTGPAGFLSVTGPGSMQVHLTPAPGDPLHALPDGQTIGLIALDLARRRRYRVNGWLAEATATRLRVDADQAYGNCPQFIQQRQLVARTAGTDLPAHQTAHAPGPLSPEDRQQVAAADTFFLGSSHPRRGADASHRGGPPGFVRVQGENNLWWPDYPGNAMFNSLGNLAVDPHAALLFLDLTTGRVLHIRGCADLVQVPPGTAGDDGGTGRRVTVTVEQAQVGPVLPLRSDTVTAYARNPARTG